MSNELERAVGRLEAKIDIVLANQIIFAERLTLLETFKTRILAYSGLVSVAVGGAWEYFIHSTKA